MKVDSRFRQPVSCAFAAEEADIEDGSSTSRITIVAIGLLMFFPRECALELLRTIQEHVIPGGIAVISVLIEGTNYMRMFFSQ